MPVTGTDGKAHVHFVEKVPGDESTTDQHKQQRAISASMGLNQSRNGHYHTNERKEPALLAIDENHCADAVDRYNSCSDLDRSLANIADTTIDAADVGRRC